MRNVRKGVSEVNVPEQLTALLNRKEESILKETGCPLTAVLVAALESGFELGLVDPLHISAEDCVGNIIRATIQRGNINFAHPSDGRELRFPLRVVITDEVSNGELDLTIEAEHFHGHWTAHSHISWKASGRPA